MIHPRITILLAAHNRERFIAETLDSIIVQTYPHWECVIVDDYSTDDTPQIIKSYVERDSRFSYYLKTVDYKNGLSGTRNMGLDIAAGRKAEYIQFFDDDDLMHPQKLELQLQPFLERNDLELSICKYEKLINEENDEYGLIQPKFDFDHDHLGDAILTGALKINSLSSFWKMSIFNEFRFDESLKYAEEWEMFVRITYSRKINYVIVDEYLFQYRKHKKTLTLGEDPNYERRKTSAVIRLKIFDYITGNKLHTEASIKFFARNFLVDHNNLTYLNHLLVYSREHKFSRKLQKFLILGIQINKVYRRIISKIAKMA